MNPVGAGVADAIGGATMTTCQPEQVWSPGVPTCVPFDCGSLALSNGVVNYSSTTFGSQATFVCNANFQLSGGTSPATCQAVGGIG